MPSTRCVALRRRGGVGILAGGTGFWLRAVTAGIDTDALPHDPARPRRAGGHLARRRARDARGAAPGTSRRRSPAGPTCATRVGSCARSRSRRSAVTGRRPAPLGYGAPILGAAARRRPRRAPRGASTSAPASSSPRASSRRRAPSATASTRPCRAFSAIGYHESWAFLDGERTLEEAIALDALHNEQFAKRQRTWFRREPTLVASMRPAMPDRRSPPSSIAGSRTHLPGTMTWPRPAAEPDRVLADATAATSTTARIIGPGTPDPLGATWSPDGVNVSVYAKRATAVDLLLFDACRGPDAEPRPRAVDRHRTAPAPTGMRSWAGSRRASCTATASRTVGARSAGCGSTRPRCCSTRTARAIAIPDGYRPAIARRRARRPRPDEERRHRPGRLRLGGRPTARPLGPGHDHLRGARRGLHGRPGSGVADDSGAARTAASSSKIPYLVDLGVTAVELLPVFAFDPYAAPGGPHQLLGLPAGLVLRAASGLRDEPGGPGSARRVPRPGQGAPPGGARGDPRRRLQPHRRGRRRRPDVQPQGLRERGVLPARPTDRSTYVDASGHRQHAQRERHDRAPDDPRQPALLGARDARRRLPLRPRGGAVARRGTASRMANPPTLWDIETDPVLAGTKLIAEAWDAGGLYEVGNFVGDRWAEWNGVFRDDVRAFVRSDPRQGQAAALRFLGSPDIYGPRGRDRRSASTSSPATTGSRSRTSSRTTRSTTRRTARTAATATTRT